MRNKAKGMGASRNTQTIMHLDKSSGFTLLEVMVALAIFATAALAMTQVAKHYTQSTAHNILRTKAQFVAMNEVVRMRLQKEWLTGTSAIERTEQGERWKIDKKAESTLSPNVQRIELQVTHMDTEQVGHGITTMTFFNHRVEAP